MPAVRNSPDLEMHYLIDDYTDPWGKPETILLLHGNAESGAVWFGWVPHLARRYRVVRPDMRGFGASTAMPRDFPWTLDIIIDDFIHLMDTLNIGQFHLVGAKLGATVARAMAARRPERVLTLTVAGAPPPLRAHTDADVPAQTEKSDNHEYEQWVRRTMASRLGSTFSPEGSEWWSKLMIRTPVSTQIGFIANISYSDITADIPRIACPTLVITSENSARGSVEETRTWQQMIPHSTLLVIPGNSNHVAASHADHCAQATFEFISRPTELRINA